MKNKYTPNQLTTNRKYQNPKYGEVKMYPHLLIHPLPDTKTPFPEKTLSPKTPNPLIP
jgi:hypothetical protein